MALFLLYLILMLKAYKYRIYPSEEQLPLLHKHFGCSRLVYNLALEARENAYRTGGISWGYNDLCKQIIGLKKDHAFFKEVNAQSLQQSLKNLDTAFKNFFKGKAAHPKFKSKSRIQSFRCPQTVKLDAKNQLLKIPKFQEGITIVLHRKFKGQIKQATITKTPSGKYVASILVENHKPLPEKRALHKRTAIGIDLGISSLAILSDGTKVSNPKFLNQSLKRIKWLRNELRRKEKGSNRRERCRLKLAREYEKLTNRRKDLLHKLSDAITKQYDTICMEDLNLKGMSARCKPKQDENGKYLHNGQKAKSGLNKNLRDSGLGMLVAFIKYKAEWRGKNFVQIGRFDASTKKCHKCGHINHDLTLEDREWLCDGCGTLHDRDINAALVILQKGLRRLEQPCQDAEAVHWDTDEASKVLNNMGVPCALS